MSNRSRRYVLLALNVFLAVNALYGAVWVVPALPRQWLTGTPFPDYRIPALTLGVIVGGGALASAVLVLLRPSWGILASGSAGAAVMVFEMVETSVVGWDLWLHAIGLGPIRKGLPGTDASGIPAPLGIPIPLWQQPAYFLLGALIIVLSAGLWQQQKRTDSVRAANTAMRVAPHRA